MRKVNRSQSVIKNLKKKKKTFFFENVVTDDIDRQDKQWIIYLIIITIISYTFSHFWMTIVMWSRVKQCECKLQIKILQNVKQISVLTSVNCCDYAVKKNVISLLTHLLLSVSIYVLVIIFYIYST